MCKLETEPWVWVVVGPGTDPDVLVFRDRKAAARMVTELARKCEHGEEASIRLYCVQLS